MDTKPIKNKLQIMALLLPGVIMLAAFTIYPIYKLLTMSFFKWDFGSIAGQSFIGLENYKNVITDPIFRLSLINTFGYTLITVPGQMILGLLAAVLIHNIPRFKVSFRIIYYIPVITSWVIVSLVFKYIFNTEGMLNYFLTNIIHVSNNPIKWLDTRGTCMAVLQMLGIWKGVGWNMVVFLAALQSVPQELYEVAAIDGCGAFKKFFYITLPSIKGTVLFALVMLTIGGFNVFTSVKMITDGKPMHQTESILTWMYYKAFSEGKFGYAAALSFIVAILLGMLAIIQFRMLKNSDAN